MSRCPYCNRELPGFDTLCQECFDAGYEQVAHPMSWWERRKYWRQWPKLTRDIFSIFLFIFGYAFVRFRFTTYRPPTTKNTLIIALACAFIAALIASTRRDSAHSGK